MTGIYIYHPKVTGYWQSQCLDNVAEYLSWYFDAPISNVVNPVMGIPICLGVHYTGHVPKGGVIFNAEQLTSDSTLVSEWYLRQLTKHKYIEYLPFAPKAYVTWSQTYLGSIRVDHCPLWDRMKTGEPKTIQVLHYGSMNFRRQYVLEYLSNRGIQVTHLTQAFGSELESYISKSKFVLHIHFYPDGERAPFRTVYASHGAVVLEEDIDFSYGELDKLVDLIKRDEYSLPNIPELDDDYRRKIKQAVLSCV